jgi:hypothetical protein
MCVYNPNPVEENFVKLDRPLSGIINIVVLDVRGEYVFDCLCFCQQVFIQ